MRTYEEQRLTDISKDLDSMRKSLTNISQCLTGIDRNLKRLADAKNPFEEEPSEVENSFERLSGEKTSERPPIQVKDFFKILDTLNDEERDKVINGDGLTVEEQAKALKRAGYKNHQIADILNIPEADIRGI